MRPSDRRHPIRVLELRSVRGTGGGPEKTILRGAARSDTARVAVTVCYIRDRRDDVFALDQLASSLGVDYVEVPERHSFDPSVWPALRRLVRQRQIDIIHGHDYKTDLLTLMLARAEGVVPLATAHGWTGHSARERYAYYPLDRWILSRFPHVVAVSEQIRQTLIASGSRPERVTTILNGIDPSLFQHSAAGRARVRASLGLTDSHTLLGSVGRLEPQKRFDLLIQAFHTLSAGRPDLRLAIAGDGSERSTLHAQVVRLGLESRCLMLGHRADVVDVLSAVDVFVQASDYEGTPNSVLEAMALALPIVATTAGGTDQLVADCVHGLLVPCGRAEPIASAIVDTLADPVAAAARAAAARHRVETDLSFESRMARLERVYEGIVA